MMETHINVYTIVLIFLNYILHVKNEVNIINIHEGFLYCRKGYIKSY